MIPKIHFPNWNQNGLRINLVHDNLKRVNTKIEHNHLLWSMEKNTAQYHSDNILITGTSSHQITIWMIWSIIFRYPFTDTSIIQQHCSLKNFIRHVWQKKLRRKLEKILIFFAKYTQKGAEDLSHASSWC